MVRVKRARNKPLALDLAPYCAQSCADREHNCLKRLVKKIEGRSGGGGWRGLGQLRPVPENLSILGTYRERPCKPVSCRHNIHRGRG